MHTVTLLALLFVAGGRTQDFEDDIGDESYLPRPSPPPPPAPLGSVGSGSSCVFKAPGGASFDLTPMKRDDHDFTGTTTGGYAYRFNVCGNTVKLCNSQPAPASKWRGTKCNNLGDPSTQTVSLLDGNDPAKGLRLKYTQGDICKRQVDGQMEIGSRMVSYDVYCDPSEEIGKLRTIQEVSMCEYVIEYGSVHACPAGTSRGALGGRGWRLVFLLLFGGLVYVGAGVYLNGRNEGKHGVEAIPHVRYWEQVPGLVRDGVQFSYVHGRAAAELGLERGQAAYTFLRERYQSTHTPVTS